MWWFLLTAATTMACASGPTLGAPGGPTDGAPARDPRALVFERNGCDECHSVTALGVAARSSTAPDLSFAAVRVPALYGVSVARFLEAPMGTMAVVLDLEIRLSPADRDTIVATLEALARSQLPRETDGSVRPRDRLLPRRARLIVGGIDHVAAE